MENLLATALGGGERRGGHHRWIPFEERYPSMAKLPSQEDSALAVAEVYTVIEYLHARKGWEGVRQVIARMQGGEGDARAVSAVMGQGFDEFQRAWKTWLKGRKLRAHPGLVQPELKFKKGPKAGSAKRRGEDREDQEADEVPEERARRFVRLGGMLRAQGRLAPAAMEYEKAQALVGPAHFVVAGRLARTWLQLGDLDRAVAAAQPAFDLYPDDGGLASVLGEAWWKKKDGERAAPYLETAIRMNPFDPAPHCALGEIWSIKKDPRAEREQRACKGLAE
jgi:tetratricopeptide (TPR) repeat protein